MPSPFPGMNPYLERSAVWSDFHEQLIPLLRRQLTPQIRPRYFAKLEEQVYIHELSANERRIFARPDISIAERGPQPPQAPFAHTVAPASGVLVEPSIDSERLTYIEIRERESNRLVTAIEVLSPTNKMSGPDRSQYLSKRSWLLLGEVNLVEIDLLRGYPRMPLAEPVATDYLVMVSRAAEKPRVDLWPISLRDPLPSIPIPLNPGDQEPTIDLQLALHQAYDDASYEDYIYDGEPEPPLTPDRAMWAKDFILPPAM